MLHILTSNPIHDKNIFSYNQNFILVHSYERLYPPRVNPIQKYHIYHEDGMDLTGLDEYQDTQDMKFYFHPVRSISEALNDIGNTIRESFTTWDQYREPTDDQDESDERMFAIACSYDINDRVVKEFNNNYLKDERNNISAVNLYKVLHVTSDKKLAEMLKMMLSTQFIYEEDPVALAYAIRITVNGTFR